MQEPLRVLQIMGIVQNGGVEAIIMNYYKHIDRDKVQFDFVVHKGSNKAYLDTAKSLGAHIYEVTPYTNNFLSFTFEIYRIIKKNHYNIVHSNMNTLSVFPLFAAWAANAKIRILHNHTTDNKAEGLRSFIKRFLRPFARLFANHYWACSKLAGEWMYGKSFVDKGKVTIIRNAIDLDKFKFNQAKRNELRNQFGLEGKFVLGHVGRFMKQKNHKFLIDVFDELQKCYPNSVLVLVGDGPLKEEIKNKVNSLGLTDKVLFMGNIDYVADLYSALDVFLLPSLYEGLPVVGIEAQANGVAFLCSDYVTKEIEMSNTINFITIDSGVKVWVDSILKIGITHSKNNRNDNLILDYDIILQTKLLELEYIRFIINLKGDCI